MPSAKYTTIALPKDLMALVDQFLAENRLGFRTRPEVLATAVREFLARQNSKASKGRRT